MPVGVCGEMGGRTLEAMALIGIGVRRLSITPVAVGPIKAMIRSLDAGEIAPARWTGCWPSRPPICAPRSPRWAEKHGVYDRLSVGSADTKQAPGGDRRA